MSMNKLKVVDFYLQNLSSVRIVDKWCSQWQQKIEVKVTKSLNKGFMPSQYLDSDAMVSV